MPQRFHVLRLPSHLREELDTRLVADNFEGYVRLSEWLEAQGFRISKSAVYRYAQQRKKVVEAECARSDHARLTITLDVNPRVVNTRVVRRLMAALRAAEPPASVTGGRASSVRGQT